MRRKSERLVRVKSQVISCSVCNVDRMSSDHIQGFAKLIDRDTILAKICPCVRDLAHDTSQHVRASLANHISGLAPLLGKDLTVEHLLPLFLHLLKDDFPDVRLNIIGKLELVNTGS